MIGRVNCIGSSVWKIKWNRLHLSIYFSIRCTDFSLLKMNAIPHPYFNGQLCQTYKSGLYSVLVPMQ